MITITHICGKAVEHKGIEEETTYLNFEFYPPTRTLMITSPREDNRLILKGNVSEVYETLMLAEKIVQAAETTFDNPYPYQNDIHSTTDQ
jgi:hypothetical protein